MRGENIIECRVMQDRNPMKATFAGGCFWCMQLPFSQVRGVILAVAGYAGGTEENPTYEEVSSGRTGHLEAVQVTWDPKLVSYRELLDLFWMQIDPTDAEGQFADRGSQYRTAIFWHDEEQRKMAEESRKALDDSEKFERPVATRILPYTTFYAAEGYHQNYAMKRPREYGLYRRYSGREAFIQRNRQTEKTVRVYSTPGCHNCQEIREFLKKNNVEFEEIDISANDRARDLIIEKTGHIGVPVVWIRDEFILGSDRRRMESLLQKR